MVGFDPACYCLGYGGGFLDRTLATLSKRPRVFGVGYEQTAMATIYPRPHDIPMEVVATEEGIVDPRGWRGPLGTNVAVRAIRTGSRAVEDGSRRLETPQWAQSEAP